MTAVYLRRIEEARNMRRFYRLSIEPACSEARCSWRRGDASARGRVTAERYDSEAPAVAALQQHAARKRRRGYAKAPWV